MKCLYGYHEGYDGDIMDVKLLWNICTSIIKDLYCAIMNAKLLQNVCTSIMMGLSLCYNES